MPLVRASLIEKNSPALMRGGSVESPSGFIEKLVSLVSERLEMKYSITFPKRGTIGSENGRLSFKILKDRTSVELSSLTSEKYQFMWTG